MFEKEQQVTELTTTDEKQGTLKINGYTNKDDKCSPSTEECLLPYTMIGQKGQLRIIQVDKCCFRHLAPTLRGDRESTIRDIEFLNPKVFLYDTKKGQLSHIASTSQHKYGLAEQRGLSDVAML